MNRPPFKAIETRYDGYKFRSRLEARWATFFNELDIEYHYEPEGYVLNGEPYLPDFWIPEWECFIEIKGQMPTIQEHEKARLLALYTQKEVAVIYGNIGFPNGSHNHSIYTFYPSTLTENHIDPQTGQRSYVKRSITGEVAYLIQNFYMANIEPVVHNGNLVLTQNMYCDRVNQGLSLFIERIQKQHDIMGQIAPLIAIHEKELRDAFSITSPNMTLSIGGMIESDVDDYQIVECSACHEILLCTNGDEHYYCPETPKGYTENDSPRLMAAYTAAREARFER